MIPEDIIEPLIEHSKRERFDIPNTLIELLFELLLYETKHNYPSLAYSPQYDKSADRDPGVRITKGLLHIFNKLPKKLYDPDKSKLIATLGELASINDHDIATLFRLRTRIEDYEYYDEQSGYKREIESLTQTIEERETGEDVSYERRALRRCKESLKELKSPDNTPYLTLFWSDLLSLPVSFEIPRNLRFEHTHVVATTGGGKSSLLRFLINQDLQTDAGLVLIEPKGDLVHAISRLVDPERLVLFSPEYPVALNIFDVGHHNEDVAEDVVELLNFVFSSIFDAKTSDKQKTLLEYCIRLMLVTPGATLQTLIDLLYEAKLPQEYAAHVTKLHRAAQVFFEKEFGDNSIQGVGSTKSELRRRINSVLRNPTMAQLFEHKHTDVKMHEIFEQGKVLLVDASLTKYKMEGSKFIGRFFMALVTLATRSRDLKKKELRPVWVYVDECWMFSTPELADFLVLARGYRVGLTLAHQDLYQLREVSLRLERAVLSTTTKFIGKCIEDDASPLAGHIRGVEPKQLQFIARYTFMLDVSHYTTSSIPIKIDIEHLDSLPQRSEGEVAAFIKARHGVHTAPLHSKPTEKKKPQSTDDGTEWSKDW